MTGTYLKEKCNHMIGCTSDLMESGVRCFNEKELEMLLPFDGPEWRRLVSTQLWVCPVFCVAAI